MNVIRILVTGMYPGVGGVQEYLINIYRYLSKKGFIFDFIVPGESCEYEEEINKLGGKIYYIPPRKKNLIKNIQGYQNIFKNYEKYSAVYYNLSEIYYIIPFLMSIIYKYPIKIVHSHNVKSNNMPYIYYLFHSINRHILTKHADVYFAASSMAAAWMFGEKLLRENKVEIIANAIDVEKFLYNESIREKVRSELNIKNEFIVGNVGRLTYQKNQKYLINIFNEFIKVNNDARLLIIGEGELEARLKKQVKELDIEDKVLFLGNRNDVNELMQAMDIFIFPSYFEGLGIVLIEAQAAGLKCLVSDIIPKEVKVNENIHYLSLEKKEKWIETILKYSSLQDRDVNIEDFVRSGYEIKTMCENFEKKLLKILRIADNE